MRLLLDECIDRRLARELMGHEVKTVPQMGWAGIKNGQLLTLAAQEFDIFITVDRNLSFEQNLPRFELVVIVLQAYSNRLADLKPFAPLILAQVATAPKGQATTIQFEG